MQRVYLIFDYFKEAFHINRNNKKIYLPQISFIIIKTLIVLTIGMYIFNWLKNTNLYMLEDREIPRIFLANFAKFSLVFFIYFLGSLIVESGLYNMYKKCVFNQGLREGDFWQGVKKYFLKFLLINLMVIAGSIVILPFLFLFGVMTLFFGFFIIPIMIMIATIFITFWKISLVVNDSKTFPALKDSFSFSKSFFFPLVLLQIIHSAFSVIGTQSGFSFNANFNSFRNMTTNTPVPYFNYNWIENLMGIVLTILIPVITISTLISSLIKMVFDVFFSLSLFVAYKNKFDIGDTPNKEVPRNVV